MKSPRFIYLTLSAASIAAFALPEVTQAQTWSGASNNNWNNAGNWSALPVSGGSLVFTSATGVGGLNLNNDLTSGSFTLGGTTAITFNAGAGAYVIGDGTTTANAGNAFILGGNVLNNSTSLQTINNSFSTTAARTFTTTASGGDIMLTGVISGASGGVTKAGSGTLTLTNTANSFTGAVSVSAGTLRASDSTVYAAGDQNITTTVLGQATSNGVSFAGNANVKTLDLRYNGQSDATAQKLQLLNSKGGNLLINASSTNSTINVDRESGTGTNKTIAFFNSNIANGSVLGVTGANGYSLGLGTLSVGTGGAAGNITISPTTANVTIGNVNNAGTTGFAHTLVLDGTSSGNTITGVMANSATGGGVLSVTKQNSSTWTFSGVNTYTGATAINGGKLTIASTGRINATSGVSIGAGEFNYNSATALSQGVSFSGTGGTLRGTGTITPAVSVTSGNTVAAGTDTSTLGTLTFGGSLTGTTGATFSLKLNSGTVLSDHINAAGISLGGVTLALIDLGSVTLTSGTFTILHSTSTSISGTFFGLNEGASITVGFSSYIISYAANSGKDITLTAIPEPSTWAAFAGVLALASALLARRSRRAV